MLESTVSLVFGRRKKTNKTKKQGRGKKTIEKKCFSFGEEMCFFVSFLGNTNCPKMDCWVVM